MAASAKTAQAGDCFILLEPDASEVAALRRRQAELQAHYGGRPHQRIHLTCQRFSPRAGDDCAALAGRLRAATAGLAPFPIIGVALELREAPFWGTHLLRWTVQPSDPVCHFIEGLERLLRDEGYAPDFVSSDWKTSAHVTALEGAAPHPHDALALAAPERLFLASYVVLSRLAPDRSFSILDRIGLISP